MSTGKNELIPTNKQSRSSSTEEFHTNDPGRFQITKDAPDSIQALFTALPERLREKIVGADESAKSEPALSSEWKEFLEEIKSDAIRILEKISAGFDEKMKEEFAAKCLNELFRVSAYKERLDSSSGEKFESEIIRLADTIWRNRGKKGDELELFNAGYYEQFSLLNKEIISKIEQKEKEIAAIRAHHEKLPKFKRLRKQGRFSEIYDSDFDVKHMELKELMKQKERLDESYANKPIDKMYHRSIEHRQRDERLWTESLSAVSEYCDPTEMATILAEELDNLFHREYFYATAKGGAREEAKKKMAIISEALRKWYEDHKFEGSLKQTVVATKNERETKTITYFKNLLASYLRGKKDGLNDDEQNNTIRLMEVALTILSKD